MTQNQFQNALLGLSDKLHFYALSLTSDTEKANDLLQETFLKALMHSDKFTQNTNLRAWIYTIMKNTFINDYRRGVKAKQTFDGVNNEYHLMNSPNKVFPSPDSLFCSKDINKSIDELDDGYKVPFNLFLQGFKYKEIAEELELPLGTVKSRIFFTRKKLEKVLREYSHN